MKLPFFNKNTNSSSTSWPWPSCHQNPKTLSFRNTTFNKTESSFRNSSDSTPTRFFLSDDVDTAAPPPESIENVIERLRLSERLIFERKGESNSILEEATKSKVPNRSKGFVLLTLESNDPHSDFKRSMDEMIESHSLRDWKSLEKLLYWYLKVNVKSSHGFIFAAFADLVIGKNSGGITTPSSSSTTTGASCRCSSSRRNVNRGESPSSPLSFYTSCSSSCSSSDESSSSVRRVSSSIESPEDDNNNNNKRVRCLSSLLEMDEKIKEIDVDLDVDGYVSC